MLSKTIFKNMGSHTSKMETKILLAMDFDHTVIDGNTDVEVQGLASEGKIPDDVRKLYSKKCWTDYMQRIFELFHEQGITKRDYAFTVQRLGFTHGMRDLIRDVGATADVELVVISDSNSVFIDMILDYHDLKGLVNEVFTNPAHFDENGCLRIGYYHEQDWCELSTKNLCKGHVLTEFVKRRQQEGVKFKRVVYVGDGKNDLCPGAKLKKHDVLCARMGFTLEQLLKSGHRIPLKADVVYWQSGREIYKHLDLPLPRKTEDDDID